MPEPRAMNIAIFLDDVSAANGPLLLLPRSHTHLGLSDQHVDAAAATEGDSAPIYTAEHDTWSSSYPLWTVGRPLVEELAQAGGVVSPHPPSTQNVEGRSLAQRVVGVVR